MPANSHGTLSASTVATSTLDQPYTSIRVVNRDTTLGHDIFFTLDGTTPTVSGANTHCVCAQQEVVVSISGEETATVVKVIATNASPYSIEGLR